MRKKSQPGDERGYRARGRTFGVIRRLVSSFPPDPCLSLSQHKHDDPATERHDEPIAPSGKSANLFAELEFGYGAVCFDIVEDDLVRRVQRRRWSAYEEDEIGPFERDADRQRRVGQVCAAAEGAG